MPDLFKQFFIDRTSNLSGTSKIICLLSPFLRLEFLYLDFVKFVAAEFLGPGFLMFFVSKLNKCALHLDGGSSILGPDFSCINPFDKFPLLNVVQILLGLILCRTLGILRS